MTPVLLTADALQRARTLRDLSDPAQGPHALQRLIERIVAALASRWRCATRLYRADPVVAIEDNYDRLHYPADGAARDARYTRYVSESLLLRTHTTALIPPLLRSLAPEPPDDVLLVCPGLVYRRDSIDRLHTGEPHQMDLWRVAARPLMEEDLQEMIAAVVNAALPGATYRCNPAVHPYTLQGQEVEVREGNTWVEIGECGLALPAVLEEAGIDTRRYSGLAMGVGMDRLLMRVKGIDDIRLLRSTDARIAAQMLDLAPYRPVSNQPAIRRDLSVAVVRDCTPEEIGDRARQALGDGVEQVESIHVVAETPYEQLPPAAVERLGMQAEHKNVLLRLVIRDPVRTLTDEEANEVRDTVYAAVHEGSVWHWAARAAGVRT